MRPLSKIDVILHKVGIDTQCYKYWHLPKAETASSYLYYKRLCKSKEYDFTGEYDMYIAEGWEPEQAYEIICVDWIK